MDRDYSKGKIYKIVANTDEKYLPYVGSTIQGLAERMGGHRANYKRWKEEETTLCSSFELFDKFGITKCKIILLEEYPCENIMQLLMKEREWFDKIECCNQFKPYRSLEEREDYHKEYVKHHKEETSIYNKNYREQNKERLIEKEKIYREKNREVINEKKRLSRQLKKDLSTL
jgi:hypothetical protein